MTVNPFLVLVPRDREGTDFVSKGEIYPLEALAGSQSSPESSENIIVYTKGWSSNILLNVISMKFLMKLHRLEKPTNEAWADSILSACQCQRQLWILEHQYFNLRGVQHSCAGRQASKYQRKPQENTEGPLSNHKSVYSVKGYIQCSLHDLQQRSKD